jgi:nucleoside-diphosphate-sugar epimerase
MRLLVTGASGFLGRNVLTQAPRDWDIVAVYHDAHDFPEFVALEGLDRVRVVRCDLTNASDVSALRATAEHTGPVDAALYLAANGDPAASARDPLRDLQLNTVALLTFLEYCPVPRLVYLSSGAVYDGLSGIVTPTSRVEPRLPYSISKLASEEYIRFYADRRGAPATFINVRFFGAFGPYEPLRKITTRFLTAVNRGDPEFTLRGDGRNLIDFMYVDDAVRGLLTLVADDRPVRATIDFASGQPTSVNDVVNAMVRLTGSDIQIRRDGHSEEYIEFRSGDRRLADDYGFTPQVSFDAGFERLRAFIATHSGAAVRG